MNEILFSKILFHNFWTYKNRSNFFLYTNLKKKKKTDKTFYKSKTFFFLKKNFQKQFWFFWISTKLNFLIKKTYLNFLSQKKNIFFLDNKNRSEFFFLNKEVDAFINKFVWFTFFHMYNISFIACIKRVDWSQESRRPNSVGAE